MIFDRDVQFDFSNLENNIIWQGKCGAYIDHCKTRFKISLCAFDFERPGAITFISIETLNGPCVHVKFKNYGFSSKESKTNAALRNTTANQYRTFQSMSDVAILSGNRQVCVFMLF